MTSIADDIPGNAEPDDDIDLGALLAPVGRRWKTMLLAITMAGVAGAGASYLVTPQYTAVTVFLVPQQQQSSASSALASLGAFSALGSIGSSRSYSDEYIALMQSTTVSDRIIKKFDLKRLWDEHYLVSTRKRLLKQVEITAGKRDGLVHVAVTETDPERAANMANQYIEELRALTNVLAVTEAQSRRVFFENLLQQTRDKLASAQGALEASGFNAGMIKAQPSSAAESYARIRAELTSAQVKLQVLRGSLADGAPAVQSQMETVNALTSQLAKLEEQGRSPVESSDYINRYREFKYEETLFQLFAKQYESARVDESREGALIQVLDPAMPPELKSFPNRGIFGLVGALIGLLVTGTWLAIKHRTRVDEPA